MAAAATTQAREAAAREARSAAATAAAAKAAAAATAAPPQPTRRVHQPALATSLPLATPPEADPPKADLRRAAATRPHLRRPPLTLFGIHVGQIITWQVVVLAVLLVLPQPRWAVTTVMGIALLLLVVTMIPVNGRWLYQWLALWIRYACRRRRWAVPDTQEGALGVLLRAVMRGAQIDVLDIDATPAGLIRHAGGVTVVLSPAPIKPRLIGANDELVLPLSDMLPSDDENELVVSAQLVVHCVPAPSMCGESSTAADSYRWLSDGAVPSHRTCWVALQVIRTPEDHTDDALNAALTSAVHRVQRRLRKAGMRGHILTPDEVAAELIGLSRIDRAVPRAGDTAVIRERWRRWFVGREVQVIFQVADWPDLGTPDGRSFLDALAAVPTLGTTIAVAVRRAGKELELEAAVRMTLPDAKAAKRAAGQLDDIAGRAGARMHRLDGQQGGGLGASLPLGGFLS